jgi:hypothetical protein
MYTIFEMVIVVVDFMFLKWYDNGSLLASIFVHCFRSGHLDIAVALNMSLYLVKEDEYVPWQIALASLGYIGELLEGHPDYILFKVTCCSVCLEQLSFLWAQLLL